MIPTITTHTGIAFINAINASTKNIGISNQLNFLLLGFSILFMTEDY